MRQLAVQHNAEIKGFLTSAFPVDSKDLEVI